MLTMEKWVTIKTLKHLHPDLGTRQLAIFIGFSRNTIERALTQDEEQTYIRPPVINHDLKSFTE